jgi:SEC-C motif-containing protein
MANFNPNDLCPCQSGKKYKKCCRPVHTGVLLPDPPALVRARYSAYALGLIDFLMQTTHPEGPHYNPRADRWRATLESFCLTNRFLGVQIVSAEGDRVLYRAELEHVVNGLLVYTEDCEFRQVNGRWKYFDGVINEQKDEA